MKNNYDIAIIGAGISSGYTLIQYIARLDEDRPEKPVRIAVLDKTTDFWAGFPYGSRSGRNPLIITALKEFIPQETERNHFKNWLNENRNWLFDNAEQKGGLLGKKWLETHKTEIIEGKWDDLFLPRYAFGFYMQQYLTSVLNDATEKKLIDLQLIQCDVKDVRKDPEGFRLEFISPINQTESLFADKLLLSVGSPPNIGFSNALSKGSKNEPNYIADIYEPSLDANLNQICEVLEKVVDPAKRQVLIIGSNASTLDVLYALNNSKKASELIHKFLVLSPNGAFPHKISQVPFAGPYVAANLERLTAKGNFKAEDILQAVHNDVDEANARQLNIADIFPFISRAMLETLDLLNLEEQKKFVSIIAVEIGKLQRRAGHEYLAVVEDLLAQGRFEFIKGRFVHYISKSENGPGCLYTNPGQTENKKLTDSIAVVITCAGFQNVTESSSDLIQNLIRSGICVPNDSNRGFRINDNFETTENCYLMGPLVAGNIIGQFRVWHAESCARIINMSKVLAEVLRKKKVEAV